jgi:hypothetical protein
MYVLLDGVLLWQWSLEDGCVMLGMCKVEALSIVLVPSTTRMTKIMQISMLKIAWRFSGGDDFCSVHEIAKSLLYRMIALVLLSGCLEVCDVAVRSLRCFLENKSLLT